jgi:D-arabinose 1-dehydrogenase-like Zn-dependent alcohol dehydrogenase
VGCGEIKHTTYFDIVLHRKTVRGSIVGTRIDLAETLAFAAEGKAGKIQRRIVMQI